MSKNSSLLSQLWANPRCRAGLGITGIGLLLVVLGERDLLKDSAHQVSRWTVYFGSVIFLPGALIVMRVWREGKTALALANTGFTVPARVTTVKKDWLSRGYALHYSFNDATGRSYGGLKILPQREAFTWRIGDEGKARFDPANPGINAWIGGDIEFDDDGESARVTASVIDVTERNYGGKRNLAVRYRYRDHLGEMHENEFIEDGGVGYEAEDSGEVEYDPRRPSLSHWLGKTQNAGDVAILREAKPATTFHVAPLAFVPASAPSGFTLFKRCIPLRRSLANLVWFLFYSLILLAAFILATDEPTKEVRIGLTVFCIGLLIFFWFGVLRNWLAGIRQFKDWRRLLTRGIPVEGTVTDVEEKRERWGRWNWKPGWVVSYRYKIQNGISFHGDSGYLSRKEAAQWRTRDKCVILYDQKEPGKSLWIGRI